MAGSIIAAIITVHITTNATASCSDQPTTGMPVIAIPLMLSMLMPSMAEPPGAVIPIGSATTKAWCRVSAQAPAVRTPSDSRRDSRARAGENAG